MIDTFFLGSFVAYNCGLLALKMKYIKIENQTKNDIIKNGLYHFTSEENAEKIMQDGYIKPSRSNIFFRIKKNLFFCWNSKFRFN